MIGPSYSGAIQWLVVAGDAPALRAIAPNITASNYYEGWTYQGGAFEPGFLLSWTLLNLSLPAASAAMTLDQYGHLFGDRLDEVSDAMDAARRAAVAQLLPEPRLIKLQPVRELRTAQ
ncbi:MAG: uncharacterized protein QOE97_1109 [Pseudonocardiales bacterium]|jgi:predicted acyl esterase|nr:uncharacterized protein [Pseudonocardiales bacterium]